MKISLVLASDNAEWYVRRVAGRIPTIDEMFARKGSITICRRGLLREIGMNPKKNYPRALTFEVTKTKPRGKYVFGLCNDPDASLVSADGRALEHVVSPTRAVLLGLYNRGYRWVRPLKVGS